MYHFRVFLFDADGETEIVELIAASSALARRVAELRFPGCDVALVDQLEGSGLAGAG